MILTSYGSRHDYYGGQRWPVLSGSDRLWRRRWQPRTGDGDRRSQSRLCGPRCRRRRPPWRLPGESATSYIVGGLLMILVGLAMTGIGGVLLQEGSIVVGILIGGVGVILAVVGQLLGFMGVIAGGVRLGMRWHRYDAQR